MKPEKPEGIATQRVLYFVCHLSRCGNLASHDAPRIFPASSPDEQEVRGARSILFSTN